MCWNAWLPFTPSSMGPLVFHTKVSFFGVPGQATKTASRRGLGPINIFVHKSCWQLNRQPGGGPSCILNRGLLYLSSSRKRWRKFLFIIENAVFGVKSHEKRSSVQKYLTNTIWMLVYIVCDSIKGALTMRSVPWPIWRWSDVSPHHNFVLTFLLFSVWQKFSWIPRHKKELFQRVYIYILQFERGPVIFVFIVITITKWLHFLFSNITFFEVVYIFSV